MLALEAAISKKAKIFPLLVGRNAADGLQAAAYAQALKVNSEAMSNFFEDGSNVKSADIVAINTNNAVAKVLEKQGLTPSPTCLTRTVTDTVKEVLSFQGQPMWHKPCGASYIATKAGETPFDVAVRKLSDMILADRLRLSVTSPTGSGPSDWQSGIRQRLNSGGGGSAGGDRRDSHGGLATIPDGSEDSRPTSMSSANWQSFKSGGGNASHLSGRSSVGSADLDARFGSLHRAAEKGAMPGVEYFLDIRESEVDELDDMGMSALHKAAANDHGEIVQLLLMRQADPSRQDNNGATPLYYAADNGHESVCRLLITVFGKELLRIEDNEGRRPLHAAASGELRNSLSVCVALIDMGADVCASDGAGLTAIDIAASCGNHKLADQLSSIRDRPEEAAELLRRDQAYGSLFRSAEKGSVEGVVHFVDGRGEDVNDRDEYGKTPLMWAADNGELAVVRLLLSRQADPMLRDSNGCTALFHAADNGEEEVCRALVAVGGKELLQTSDIFGKCPLHAAASGELGLKSESVCRVLVSLGASIDAKDDKDQTAADIARACKNMRLATMLDKMQENPEEMKELMLLDRRFGSLHETAAKGSIQGVTHFLDRRGMSVDDTDASGATPLLVATRHGRSNVVQFLLDRKADLLRTDNQGISALAVAADTGSVELVRVLGSRGGKALLNLADDDKRTPLHCAASGELDGSEEVCRLLISLGADTSLTDSVGSTPEEVARSCMNEKLAQAIAEAVEQRVGTPIPTPVSDEQKASLRLEIAGKCEGAFEGQGDGESRHSGDGESGNLSRVASISDVPDERDVTRTPRRPTLSDHDNTPPPTTQGDDGGAGSKAIESTGPPIGDQDAVSPTVHSPTVAFFQMKPTTGSSSPRHNFPSPKSGHPSSPKARTLEAGLLQESPLAEQKESLKLPGAQLQEQ